MNSEYWNEVYANKLENETSWFQQVPKRSLELIEKSGLDKEARIIDIGGGESRLVDHLLDMGFSDLTVLDISSKSLEKLRIRLGEKSKSVRFIVSDVTHFHPTEKYYLWHDRATFHFLTEFKDIAAYVKVANEALSEGGSVIVSTFSKSGPKRCSGLAVSRYSEDDLKQVFARYFQNTGCFEDVHETPWGAKQSFVYCGFQKLPS